MTDTVQVADIYISALESEVSTDTTDTITDVIVEMTSGSRYSATFMTSQNMQTLLAEQANRDNGKLHYFYFKNLVVIKNIERENIKTIVTEMIDEGDFQLIFKKL